MLVNILLSGESDVEITRDITMDQYRFLKEIETKLDLASEHVKYCPYFGVSTINPPAVSIGPSGIGGEYNKELL